MEFVRSLSLEEGLSHEVEREHVYTSVMTLFVMNREVIVQEFPVLKERRQLMRVVSLEICFLHFMMLFMPSIVIGCHSSILSSTHT